MAGASLGARPFSCALSQRVADEGRVFEMLTVDSVDAAEPDARDRAALKKAIHRPFPQPEFRLYVFRGEPS